MKEKRCPNCGEKTTEKICPKCKTKLKSNHHAIAFIVLVLAIILLAFAFIAPHNHVNSNVTANQTVTANKNMTANQTIDLVNAIKNQSSDANETVYQSDDYSELTRYLELSTDKAINPPSREKVQFDGKYFGHTDWSGSGNQAEYMPPPTYDVIQYGGAYIFLGVSYQIPNLQKYENKTIHFEGEFDGGNTLEGHTDNGFVAGNLFHPDKIVVK